MMMTNLVKLLILSATALVASADFRVKFDVITTAGPGSFVFKVHDEWAPIGAAHFRKLVENGHYDDTRFFRVIPSFMVQFGISGDPAVSAVASKDTIKDEPVLKNNKLIFRFGYSNPRVHSLFYRVPQPGYVSFAKTGAPNSRSTQLFINYVDNSRLDGMGFSPFAEVEAGGMEVVKKIYNCGEKPQQGSIQSQGNAYLDKQFPDLSRIVTATIIPDDEL